MRQAPKESKRCRQSNEISQLQHLAAFYSSHRFSEDSCVIKKKNIERIAYNSNANIYGRKLRWLTTP